jgi:methionyl-tRNA formyltransferase
VISALETERIDVLAVFGTSLLKEPLLSMFPGRIINIHLGLSPYYRGAATIFWALYNEQPELAGATIHYIDAGVDTGSIICHVQTTLDSADTPHTIGTRIILNSVHAISDVLSKMEDGPVPGVPQWEPGEVVVTRRRDFTAAHLEEFLGRWQAGLIRRCLERNEAERPSVRLIPCDS